MIMENVNAVTTVDFRNLPDLSKAEAEPVEMSGEYWTPEKEGETRRLFFVGLNMENVVEMESGESREPLNSRRISTANFARFATDRVAWWESSNRSRLRSSRAMLSRSLTSEKRKTSRTATSRTTGA